MSTIQDVCQASRDQLASLLNMLDATSPISEFKGSHKRIKNLNECFGHWCGNLGALVPASHDDSLDNRLRNAPMMHDSILAMARDLARALATVYAIISGSRPNRSMAVDSHIQEIMAQLELTDSDEEDSDEDNDNLEAGPCDEPETELDSCLKSMSSSVSRLFQASVYIGSLAPVTRRALASRSEPFDSRLEISRVIDRYPKLGANLALARRLGEANARRSQYFTYCRDHHEGLSNPSDALDAQTKATDFDLEDATEGLSSDNASSISDQSDVSVPDQGFASLSGVFSTFTAPEPAADELGYPPVPYNGEEDLFLCPYCCDIYRYPGTEQHWRRHVLGDLEPYVCTYPECDLRTYKSEHAWFDHELRAHRRSRQCPKCNLVNLDSASALAQHMNHAHPETMTEIQLPMTTHQIEQPIVSLRTTECPFCDSVLLRQLSSDSRSKDVTMGLFRRHVGHHLRQIALLALPRSDGGLNDRESPSVHQLSMPGHILDLDEEDRFESWRDRNRQLGEAQNQKLKVQKATQKAYLRDYPRRTASVENLASTSNTRRRLEDAEVLGMGVSKQHKKVRFALEDHKAQRLMIADDALTYKEQGPLEDAEVLYRRAIETHKRTLGRVDPKTPATMADLAPTYKEQEHLEEVAALEREAAILEREAFEHKSAWEQDQFATYASTANRASTPKAQRRSRVTKGFGMEMYDEIEDL